MKKIEELDQNFKMPKNMPEDIVFYDVWEKPFEIYGLVPNEEKTFCRLPLYFLPECSSGVKDLAYHTAGACVRFSTDSDYLAIAYQPLAKWIMGHMAASGQSGLELFEESDEGTHEIKNTVPELTGGNINDYQTAVLELRGGMRHYALYLPLYNGLKSLQLGFKTGSAVETGRKPKFEKPIVFYGSSITQGGCASKVGTCYTTILCRRLDAAQINLGFSGNGKGEENMARYIASIPMSAFVFDYDHNAPSEQHLWNTHARFYNIIREAQPELPIIIVSLPDADKMPHAFARRRLAHLETYTNALKNGDRNVYFVDGWTLFGGRDRDMCTVDGTHPTDLGFWRMAEAIEPALRVALNIPFAGNSNR